jgi:hypothetical protein
VHNPIGIILTRSGRGKAHAYMLSTR